MGLIDKSNEKKTFLNIVSGAFAKRVAEGTSGAVEREIEYPKGTKKMIWETHHDSLEAIIKSVEIKEGDKFGDQLLINLQDGIDLFTVSLGLSSREAKGFMSCLPNIDISKDVTLEPYNYERKKDGKKMIGMGVVQNGEKVPYFYTSETGMPSGEVGQEMDTDEFKILMQQQTIFLKKKTKEWIAGQGAAKQQTMTPQEISPTPAVDDLPF